MNTTYLKPAENLEPRRHHARQKTAVFRFVLFLITVLILTGSSLEGWGQVNITDNSTKTESFTGYLGTSTYPANWDMLGTGSSYGFRGTAQTTGTSGGWYGNNNMSFLGSSNAANGNATWKLRNISGVDVNSFSLSFTGRLWKTGTASPVVRVYYLISSSSTFPVIGTTGWTEIPSCAFSDATTNITTGATLSSGAVTVTVANNNYLYLRWIHPGGSSSDNLGWDEISFTPTLSAACTPPSGQASFTSINSIGTSGFTINFGAGTGGIGRLVVVSAAAITGSPISGTSYTTGLTSDFSTTVPTIAAGEKVVYKGSGSSVAVTGLNSGTLYYVKIFEYNTGDCYLTTGTGNTGSATTTAATPNITLADNGTQVTAANVSQGATNHVLHKSSLAVTTSNATLTGMTCTTNGTYISADVTNLKVWYSTDNSFSSGSDVLLSTLTTPGTAGAKTFPSFASQTINSGATGYIFITADIAAGATVGNTIYLNALTTADFTFSSGNKSGSTTAGGTQTITAASTGGTHLVISQVYGGGGNSGATYRNDYIELFNPTCSSISVDGWSVQYAGATSSSWAVTNLSGSVAPGKYYLIQEAAGAGGTKNLPTPDATGSIAMSGSDGKVALVNNTTALSGTCPTGSSIIDFVGFGTANCYEGAAAPATSNTNSIFRSNNGCTDTDNNSSDFTASAAYDNARNSSSLANPTCPSCGPTINVSPPTLTGFTYVVGSGPSAEQSFTINGSSLTANISIAPPTNYEISTGTGGAFVATNPITLTQGGGIVSNTTIYVRLKAGLSVGSYNAENIAATSTGATPQNVTCSGTVTATPSITLADNGTQITAADVTQGTTNHVIHKSSLAITSANTTLTGMTCTTNGSYISADVTNLKVWYSTDNNFSSGSDVLLSTLTTPGTAGGKTFPSFASQTINSGATGYIFITADIAAGATIGNTIYLNALTTTDFTFSSGNKSGSTTASGVQTFVAVCGSSENFEESTTSSTTGGTGMPSSYSTGNYVLSSGTWNFNTVIRATSNFHAGSAGCQLKSETGTFAVSPTIISGGVGVVSFYAASSTAGGAINVSYQVNGGGYTSLNSFTGLTTTSTLKQVTINDASGNIQIKFTRTAGTVILDDISWTCYGCVTPTLSSAAQAESVCDGAPLTIDLAGMLPNSTNNTIEYTINGIAQTPVTGINTSGTGTASFTIDDLSVANNGQTLQITKIINGSCNATFAQNVTLSILARPATPTASSNSPICAGSNLNLTSNATGTIAWTGPNTFTSTLQNPTISSATVAASGVYNVTSTVGGCTSYSGTTSVMVEGTTASITITASPSNIVATGTLVTFTASPVNGGLTPVYQWQKNGSNVGTNSNTYSDATLITGDYITCTMTSNSTCVSIPTVISNTITMTVNAVIYYCGYEDFTNSNASATYADRTFTGNNGVTWSFTESRDENNDANNSGIDIPALMFRNTTSHLISGAVPGGIGDFSVKLYKGFNSTGNRSVELFVNGVSKGTSAVFDDDLEHVFTVAGINTATVTSVELVNKTDKQIIVDDISWTCYGNTTPTLFVSEPSLTGMQYILGNGPSAAQSYQVSGVFLTGFPGTITVTAPADYEISLDNSTYASVLSVPYTTATLSPTTVYVRLVSGLPVGTYNNEMITHSGGGVTSTVEVSCNGNVILSVGGGIAPGDLAILAFNTDIGDTHGTDEISFVCFVPIPIGTRIDITDNAYRKCGDPNGWGVSEGWIRLERTTSELPEGVIITVRVTNGTPTVVYPDANWIATKPQPTIQGEFNMNAHGEQIFFMAGGEVTGNASAPTSDAGRYSGYFLYGFNTKKNVWTPVCADADGGGTQNSAKPDNFDCFLVWPTAQADRNKYTGDLTPATQRNWIDRIGDTLNWSGYASDAAYDLGPNYYQDTLDIIPGGFSNGKWNGNTNINWFECSNWESMRVPEYTTNVAIPASGVVNEPTIGNPPVGISNAFCNDLTIYSPHTLTMNHANSRLDIYGDWVQNGNLSFTNGVVNFMDDNSSLTGTGNMDFFNLAMKKVAATNTLTIGKDISINLNGILTLTSGIITTDNFKVTVNNPAIASVTGHPVLGSVAPNSYINGKLRRFVNSTGSYDFPVGTIAEYEYANINLNSSSGLGYIDAFFTAPHTTPIDISSLGLLVNSDLLMELLNYGFWTLTPNAGTYNYDVTLTSRGHTNQGLTAGSHAVIKRPNGASPWVTQGTHNNATQSMGSSWNWVTAKRTALTVFSDFAIAKNNVNSPLPVDLFSFSAICNGQNIDLRWTTASETNNAVFTIEKSADALKWDAVGTINGSGNSNTRIDYNFSDYNPFSGTSYYRLKQTDYDGKSETFSPVAVICGGMTVGQGISYYPNPFTSEIQVDLSNVDFKNAVIRVYDMLGNMVFEKNLTATDAENQTTKLNLTDLKVGIYTVEFKSESFTNVAKIVKNYFSARY